MTHDRSFSGRPWLPVAHTSFRTGIALLALVVALAGRGQLRAQPASVPVACPVTLDSLDARLRRNYAGYLLEVAPRRADAYREARERARRAATSAALDTDRCTAALRAFVEWFDDPHLFLFQSTTADTAANRARERALVHDTRDEAAIRAELARADARRDPLEGIWRDGALRVGIVRQRPRSDTLVAIVLTTDTVAWPVGAVRARFVRRRDAGGHAARYDATLLARNFGQQQLTATLHRRTILRFSPGMWGREAPLAVADSAVRPDADPRRPQLARRERSIVITIPSHDGPYQRVLDSLVTAHREALLSTPLLILDLRGNEGGGSLTTRALHPFLVSREVRPTPYDSGAPVMLSSPEQLAFVRRLGGEKPSPAVQRLLARLEQQPGQFVPMYDQPMPSLPTASPLDGAWRVAVLTDRGTVSAAEVTVQMALRSTRATTVGEPTAGALDYQQTAIIGLGTGDRRWALGYPTIAAHADLPARGIRGTGIRPEHPLRWASVADPYAAVEGLLLDGCAPTAVRQTRPEAGRCPSVGRATSARSGHER